MALSSHARSKFSMTILTNLRPRKNLHHPISIRRPPRSPLRAGRASNGRQLSISIGTMNIRGGCDDPGTRDCDQENHPEAAASRDGAACRQHHLRNGAARGISAALRPLAALRRLGSGGGRSLAGLAPINPDRRAQSPDVRQRRSRPVRAPGPAQAAASKAG